LQSTDGLAIHVGVSPQVSAREHSEGGCAADNRDDEKPEFPAAQRKEHGQRKLAQSADGTRMASGAGCRWRRGTEERERRDARERREAILLALRIAGPGGGTVTINGHRVIVL
jgi:hypothetical protein